MQSDFDIDDLLFRFFRGETSPEENRFLLAWKRENEENRIRFEALRDLWMVSATASCEGFPDPAEELSRLRKTIAREENPPAPSGSRSGRTDHREQRSATLRNIVLKGVAAAVLFIAAMGCGALLYRQVLPPRQAAIPSAEIPVPDTMLFTASRGSLASATLPDGTVVRLNAGSSLTYTTDYGRRERPVTLVGEAFFQVRTDPGKPFVVHAGNLSIVATGTTFNVKAYPEERFVTTTLETGAVHVRGLSRRSDPFSIELKPRQTFMYYNECDTVLRSEAFNPEESALAEQVRTRDIPAVRMSNVKTQLYTSWKDPRWIVEHETLASLAEKLGRRYNVSIRFRQPEAGEYRFSGSFENETIEEIMQLLRHATPIRYTIDRGKITVSVDSSRRKAFENAAG